MNVEKVGGRPALQRTKQGDLGIPDGATCGPVTAESALASHLKPPPFSR
jgi:hypothetical protein